MSLARELLDTEHDFRAFERVAETISTGDALALVGAGFSARAGYPGWNDLLERMAARVEEDRRRMDAGRAGPTQKASASLAEYADILWRGEEYRSRLTPDAYGELLTQTFGGDPPRADDCVDALVQLPFRHILTTNYDYTLEAAHERLKRPAPACVNWADEKQVLKLMFDFLSRSAPRSLIYLHGRIDRLDSIVLTDRDYTERYLRSDSTVKKLFAIFAMHRVVFFGFSLADPDLAAIIRQVTGALGFETPRHFAFMGVRAGDEREVERKRLNRKFGIEAIFYDRENGHARLALLMRELLARCPRAAEATPATAAQPPRESPVKRAAEPTAPAFAGPRDRGRMRGGAPEATPPAVSPPPRARPPVNPDDPHRCQPPYGDGFKARQIGQMSRFGVSNRIRRMLARVVG